jgi:hypothetical protein
VVSPYINHFLQPDSIIPNPANPQSLNRFGYVLNNPIRFNDPTGRVCEDPEKEDAVCFGSGTTKVGNRMVRGNGAELGKAKNLNKKPQRVYDPEEPPYKTFSIEFQMFYVTNPTPYADIAEDGFTNFPGGGDPEFIPKPYPLKNDGVYPANPADRWGLINDVFSFGQPYFVQWYNPHDQHVYMNYSADSNGNTLVIGLSIRNGSKAIPSMINYRVSIIDTAHFTSINTRGSAAPGQSAVLPLGETSIYSGPGGLNISIVADTICPSTCYDTNPNTLDFQGQIRFNFNP